jgi:hypothetical protein
MTHGTTRLRQGPAHAGRKYWAILLMFGLVGTALFTVNAVMSLPSRYTASLNPSPKPL